MKKNIREKKIIIGLLGVGIVAMIIVLLYIFRNPFVKEYTIEAGNQLTVENLIKDEKVENPEIMTLIDETIINKVGEHVIEVKGNNHTFKVKLHVVDTIAPEVTTQTYNYFIGDEFDVNQFIKEIKDMTSTSVVMKEQVDLTKDAKHKVHITITDEGNNIVEKEVALKVEKDVTPPEITVDDVIVVSKGDSILYRQLIKVVDNRDKEITNFTIDNSQVDLTKIGTYPVTITATDFNNNTSTKTIKIKIQLKNKAQAKTEAKAYAQEIIGKIIKNSMSKQQKIKAVYDYVKYSYSYVGKHDGTINDYYIDAFMGFETGKGDCYVVNAMARCLLEELGFKTYGLVLHGTDMDHISFMANAGDGWYHYCAFKKKSGIVIYKWTDAQMIKHYGFAGITEIPDHLPNTPVN